MRRVLVVSAMLLAFCGMVSAEIPQVLGYQGRVTENTGIPVANGTYPMQFRIYDAETGGSLLWDSGSLSVETNAGVFSVMLGESPQPTLNLDFDQDYWLLVTYRGEDQLPRKRLCSVGYAYMASGLVPGSEVVGTRSSPVLKATNYGTGAGLLGHSDLGTGVRGQSSATDGEAVLGKATAVSGVNYGVYGETSSTDGFAGYFAGRARVAGDLTVTSGGEVGIGVTSPGNPLVIAGAESDTAGTGAQLKIRDSSNGNHAFALRIGASGNRNLNLDSYWGGWQTLMTVDRQTGQVGIGTPTPQRKASVVGHVRAANDSAETEFVEIYHGGSNGLINWNGDGNFEVQYANDAKLTVQQNGSVGIGTTSPGATLDVRGSTVFNEAGGDNDFRVEGDTEPNLLFLDAGTNRVGIGTGSPDAVLHVHSDSTLNYEYVVRGVSTASTGDGPVGVGGESHANLGIGVYGLASDLATWGGGFRSDSPSGYGVAGWCTATTGTNYAVYGTADSPSGRAVYGVCEATTGTNYAVSGVAHSPSGRSVYGYCTATTGTNYGVYGYSSSTSGYAVYAAGSFAASGAKSCVVKTSEGPTMLYCQESPECWFEDFGEGQLTNGRCRIDLDPLFLETVTIDATNPMKVYVTPNGRMGDWWVEKGTARFTVVAPQGAEGTTFDYRVIAKRKGFESKRLDHCQAAEADAHLYPELREKELREFEERHPRFRPEPPANQTD